MREIPGPTGLPIIGNFFEIYPDHLGNHQRLFEQYGPIFKTTNMGRTVYHTNDPEISAIIFAETDFFTKKINDAHPLRSIKNTEAGVFLADTDTPEWRAAHKFLPPALGPKAVRHYAPTMQTTVEDAFKVFDQLDEQGEAWNVYQYMLKLGSQAVGKLVLGIDFRHFASPDAPPHELISLIAESLTLNKKVTARGDWYAKLPFGDPKRLQTIRDRVFVIIDESIQNASRGGVEDLPLQDAALKANNMIGTAPPPWASTISHNLHRSEANRSFSRLYNPRYGQQGRKAPQDESHAGFTRRHGCRLYHHQLPSVLADLQHRHLPGNPGASAPGAHRQ